MKTINYLLMLLILVQAALAVSVDENDVVISSEDTFYCNNVLSGDRCLFTTWVTVENNRASAINAFLEFDVDSHVVLSSFRNKGQSIAAVQSEGRSLHSQQPFLISSGSVETYYIDVFASEDSKFNFSVFFNGGTLRTTLDPILNISRNVSSPTLHLIEGKVAEWNDSQFLSVVNATTGLSDLSDVTEFETRLLSDGVTSGSTIVNLKFDETSGNIIVDSSDFALNGTWFDSPNLSIAGISNTGVDFSGASNSYGAVNATDQFSLNSTEEMVICFAYNSFGSNVNGEPIFDHREGGNSGWEVRGANNELRLTVDRDGSGAKNFNVNYQFVDSQFHTVCFESNFTAQAAYVDGSFDSVSNAVQSGAITQNLNRLFIGTDEALSVFPTDAVDEFCFIKGEELDLRQIAAAYNESLSCDGISPQLVLGKGLRATFPISFNTVNDYYLRTRKTSAGVSELDVYLYDDGLDSLNSLLTTHSITTGWDTVALPVVTNVSASLRLFTSDGQNISEVVLVESINDTVSPVVNSAFLNDSFLGCNDSVRLTANVTDDTFVDTVFFEYEDFSGVNYVEADKIIDTDLYFIDLAYSNFDNSTYNWTLVNGTDVLGQSTLSDPALSWSYACVEFVLPVDDEPVVFVELVFPVNGSLLNASPLDVNFTNNFSNTYQLFVNGSLNFSSVFGTGLNTIDFHASNGTYLLQLLSNYSNSSPVIFTMSIPALFVAPNITAPAVNLTGTDAYSLGDCPISTLPRALMFMFFIVMAVVFILIDAVVLERGIFGTLGGLLLFGLSLYLYACLLLVGFILSALGVLFMSYFIFRSFRNV